MKPEEISESKAALYNTCLMASWSHHKTGRKYIDTFIRLPSAIHYNTAYDINVSNDGFKLTVGLVWPKILSNIETLVKITNIEDPEVNAIHPLVGGITDSFKEFKDKVNSNIRKEHYIPLPTKVQSSVVFYVVLNQTTFKEKIWDPWSNVRLQGIDDNYANSVKDTGKIESIVS